ncbi:MAG: hypothetical protein N2Z23_00855 [Pyrinomonadaceae bacterium]|nr:hypothetical protein [Pyrinomonadaceae bacterium]
MFLFIKNYVRQKPSLLRPFISLQLPRKTAQTFTLLVKNSAEWSYPDYAATSKIVENKLWKLHRAISVIALRNLKWFKKNLTSLAGYFEIKKLEVRERKV